MKIIDVTKKLPFKKSNGKMDLKKIKYIVVHHDAVLMPRAYNTFDRLTKEAQAHIADGWGHISYHFSIDNVGDIYQCLPVNEIGFHAGNYQVNTCSIAIKFDGNMEVQQPTQKQLQAYKELINYLTTERPDMPLVVASSIKGHKEVRLAPTACPGRNLFPLIKKF